MTVVRDTGADLRNALAARLQSLSIGYHTRVSSSLVQSKVVRDVENVELMLQQVTHPLLSSIMVLIGADRHDRDHRSGVPPGLRARRAHRDRPAREPAPAHRGAQRRLPARDGGLRRTRRRDGVAHPRDPRARTRADRRDARRRRAPTVSARRACTSTCSTATSRRSRGSRCSCWGWDASCLAADLLAHRLPPHHAGRGRPPLDLLRAADRRPHALLMLIPVGARGIESVRSIAEVLQEPDLEQNEGKRRVDRVDGRLTLERATHRYPDADVGRPPRRRPRHRPGRDRRLRRVVRLGQVDAPQPRARVRASDVWSHPARRRRHAAARPSDGAPGRLGRAAGVRALRGHDPRQHRVRPSARDRTTS